MPTTSTPLTSDVHYDPTCLAPSYGATSSDTPPSPPVPLDHGPTPPAGWDYCLVFKAPTTASAPPSAWQRRVDATRFAVLHDLRAARFAYSQLWVPSMATILVRIALPEHEMAARARHLPNLRFRAMPRYSGAYVRFDPERPHVFENAARPAAGLPYFTPAERLTITQAVLSASEPWGVDINIPKLLSSGLLQQAFALHARRERNLLLAECVSPRWWRPRNMPLFAMQQYTGQRVALYFAWLAFYTRMLIGIVVLALFLYLAQWLSRNSTEVVAFARFFFGIGLTFWSSYWVRFWQRRNAVLNCRWGVEDADADRENVLRQDFVAPDHVGFYSRGGFVDLSDLARTPGEALEQGNESDDEHENTDIVGGSSAYNMDGDEYDDDDDVAFIGDTPLTDDEDDVNAPGSHGSLTVRAVERKTLMSLLRAAQQQDDLRENVVVYGGSRDADFTVVAPVTGLTFSHLPLFPHVSRSALRRRVRVSAVITGVVSSLVAAASFAILYCKPRLNAAAGLERSSSVVTGMLTAVLIILADGVWKKWSARLVAWENHHTVNAFDDSLVLKRFAFQFVSNYLSLFYIAFVKPFTPHSNPCAPNDLSGAPDCMAELQAQLISVVLTKATLEQVLELLAPLIKRVVKNFSARRAEHQYDKHVARHADELTTLRSLGAVVDKHDLRDVDAASRLDPAFMRHDAEPERDVRSAINEARGVPYPGPLDDYAEIIVQFGYLVLFGVCFPATALVHFVNNIVELRTDAAKILAFHRRSPVDATNGIGRWLRVISFLCNLSVVTVVAILTITSPDLVTVLDAVLPASLVRTLEAQPLVGFVAAEHFLFAVRWGVLATVHQIPGATYRLRARRAFLAARCLDIGWKPYFRGRRITQSYRSFKREQQQQQQQKEDIE